MNFKRFLFSALLTSAIALLPIATYAATKPTHGTATSTAAIATTSTAAAVATDSSSDGSSADAAAQQPVDTEQSSNDESQGNLGSYERAIILSSNSISATTTDGAQQQQAYTIQFLSGVYSGKTRTITNDVSSNPYNLDPRPGDKVLIFLQPNPSGGDPLAYIESFDRRDAIYWLIAIFVATLTLLAGWQGIKVAFSILLSVSLIGIVLIPSFLKGLNPIPIAFALIAVLATISSVLSTGWNRKSAVTVIGTLGGVFVAYLISMMFAQWAHLSGISSEDDRMIFDKNPMLNPQGLLFAGIAIAAMGVVQDVAVSIASGVMEVRQANARLGFKELFRSGMVVGRDHMAALANTLVFAYVGGSLTTLLLYAQSGGAWAKFINFDVIADEILRSLSGTIGLVFTVPITALLAAWFALRIKGQKRNPLREVQGWHGDHQHEHSHEIAEQ